jgi:hypothetical protein
MAAITTSTSMNVNPSWLALAGLSLRTCDTSVRSDSRKSHSTHHRAGLRKLLRILEVTTLSGGPVSEVIDGTVGRGAEAKARPWEMEWHRVIGRSGDRAISNALASGDRVIV